MSTIRRAVKHIVPQRIRLLRYELYEKLRYYPELLFSLGRTLECPFCGWHFRRFRGAGFDYPVLEEKKVVGGHYHRDNVCPRCKSNARERLAYLFLKNRDLLFNEKVRLLHVAPEPKLANVLRRCGNIRYFSADMFEPGVMIRLDVMTMPFPDDTFDAIICNHVLEHVADDRVAMAELCRVLKPDGWALLQVPIALALAQTIEDPTATTEAERIRLFGQGDHVRLYAQADYLARLESAGFSVQVHRYTEELGAESVRRYGLVLEEEVFLARPRLKPQ